MGEGERGDGGRRREAESGAEGETNKVLACAHLWIDSRCELYLKACSYPMHGGQYQLFKVGS